MANKKVKFELTAVDKTKAAFDKVTKGLKGVGGAAAGATKGIAGVGLAATATAGALALIVDKSFQAIDAIGKTSTQTGIATDTLQAFHLAARESGTTVEGANTALIKFARSVGDAQRGLKTQADIFKDLGVNIRNADGSMKSFDQILDETADGIAGLSDQTAKATALANLFGRQGIVLTGAINDLSEKGLVNFIKRAKDLGIVLSENVIRRTEAFNDAVGVIKMQIGSFVNSVATSFLPVFEKAQKFIAKKIQEMIDDAGGMDILAANIAKSVLDFIANTIVSIGHFADSFMKSIRDAQISFLEFGNTINSVLIGVLDGLPKWFGDFSGVIDGLKYSIDSNDKQIRILTNTTTNYGEKAEDTADIVRGYKDLIDELIGSNNNLSDSNNNTATSFVDIQDKLAVFKDSITDTNDQLNNVAVNSMKKFEDSIVDGLKTGKLAFKDFATYVVEQLIRVAIQQMIISKLVDPFRKIIGGENIKDYYNRYANAADNIMSMDGGGYTGMGARAGGIDGRGGFPAILHPNETVIDHTKGQGMGATVNFNISTVDAAGFDQLLASRKGLITQIINNAMNNQGKMGIV